MVDSLMIPRYSNQSAKVDFQGGRFTPYQQVPDSCPGMKMPSPKGFRCGVSLHTESKEAQTVREYQNLFFELVEKHKFWLKICV